MLTKGQQKTALRYAILLAGAVLCVAYLKLVRLNNTNEVPSPVGVVAPSSRDRSQITTAVRIDEPDGSVELRERRSLAPLVTLLVRTIDSSSAAIAGADIAIRTAEGNLDVGRTGADGSLVADLGLAPPLWVVAEREGYASAFRCVTNPVEIAQSELLMQMQPECSISGSIRLPSADAVPPGTIACAWPVSVRPTISWIHAATHGLGGRMCVAVNADNTFTIPAAVHDATYVVMAISQQSIPANLLTVRAPASGLDLELLYAYGVDVHVIEKGGSAVATAPQLFDYNGTSTRCLDGDLISALAAGSDLQVPFLDIDATGLEPAASNRMRLIYLSRRKKDRLGPVQLDLRVPGYVATQATVFAPLLSGQPAAETVEMLRESSCFGNLRVRLAGVAAGSDTTNGRIGEIRLIDIKTGRSYCLEANRRRGDDSVLGVPCATYRTYLNVLDSFSVAPISASTLSVDGSTIGALEFDLNQLGRLLIRVYLPSGEEYRGLFEAYLVKDSNTSVPIQFQSAPYELKWVPEGAYTVNVAPYSAVATRSTCESVQLPHAGSVEMRVQLAN